VRQIIIKY